MYVSGASTTRTNIHRVYIASRDEALNISIRSHHILTALLLRSAGLRDAGVMQLVAEEHRGGYELCTLLQLSAQARRKNKTQQK